MLVTAGWVTVTGTERSLLPELRIFAAVDAADVPTTVFFLFSGFGLRLLDV